MMLMVFRQIWILFGKPGLTVKPNHCLCALSIECIIELLKDMKTREEGACLKLKQYPEEYFRCLRQHDWPDTGTLEHQELRIIQQ